MAKGSNQKLKVLYLERMLLEETDEEHPLSMPEIIAKLAALDISADRKSIYADFEDMRLLGLDIIGEKRGNRFVYYAGSRAFELPELKLLVDSVQAAKFISAKKSGELIRKLGTLTSRENAKKLNREVRFTGRVKADNSAVYYSVDCIHTAIGSNSTIRFRYYQWNRKKEQELRHGGAFYEVSPWALVWDDEYYYLVAWDEGRIKHFRVDKMLEVSVTGKERSGRAELEALDPGSYSGRMFGMFSGEEEKVTLEAENRFAGILIDRFGREIFMIPAGEDRFRAVVPVSVSEQFLAWVFSLGEGIRIAGPPRVVSLAQEMIARLERQYGRGDDCPS